MQASAQPQDALHRRTPQLMRRKSGGLGAEPLSGARGDAPYCGWRGPLLVQCIALSAGQRGATAMFWSGRGLRAPAVVDQ
jgi:hypothetical protein